MKRLVFVVLLLALSLVAQAQATRPVTLSWVDSVSTTVTGYSIYVCVAANSSTPCIPATTGTPTLTATATSTSAVFNATVGNFYSIVIVANAPPCGNSITTPCGNSAPATFLPNPVAIPPQTASASTPTDAVP